MLDKGDSVGLVACSDGFPNDKHEVIEEVENSLYDMGYKAVTGNIYRTNENRTLSSRDRADVFNEMVRNPEIKVIFDISGGDSANEILDYVDYDMLEENGKPVFGYSDLTTLLNAIYCKTGICTYLYQIRNIITGYGERQKADLEMVLSGESDDLYNIDYEFVRGEEMKGVLIGGNIRCFLKLAGTSYMPSFRHKVLFLESNSGRENRIRSYFTQLKQMGVFNEVNGVLLGTFTELAQEGITTAAEILIDVCDDKELAIAVTDEVGHGADSKAVVIGREIEMEK